MEIVRKIRLSKDIYIMNQKHRFSDLNVIEKVVELSDKWIETSYLRVSAKKKYQQLVKHIAVISENEIQNIVDMNIEKDEDDEIDIEYTIMSIILGKCNVKDLSFSKNVLEKIKNVFDQELIKLEEQEMKYIYDCILTLSFIPNIIDSNVKISNQLKQNIVRNKQVVSTLYNVPMTKLNKISLPNYENYVIHQCNSVAYISPISNRLEMEFSRARDFIIENIENASYLFVSPIIANRDIAKLINIYELEKTYLNISQYDLGLITDPSLILLLLMRDTHFTDKCIYTTTTSFTKPPHSSTQLAFVYFVDKDKSCEVFEDICDIVEKFYTEMGCHWTSEYVVSGCMTYDSSNECTLYGITPLQRHRVSLATIRNTTDYHTSRLNITNEKGDHKHAICVNFMDSDMLYSFMVDFNYIENDFK